MARIDAGEDWAEPDEGVLDPEPAVDAVFRPCEVEAVGEEVAVRPELCVPVTDAGVILPWEVNELSSDDRAELVNCDNAQLSASSESASIELYISSHWSKLVCIGGGKSVVSGLKTVV